MVVMAQPWKHPKTGVYYIRRHLPADVREKFGVTLYKRTLGTKSPSEAKRLFAVASAELDEAIALARSDFKLTLVNAKALAGEWLRAAVDEDEQERSVGDREAMIDEVAGVSGYALQYEAMQRADEAGKSRPVQMRKAVADEVVGILRARGIALAEGSEDYQRLADEVFWAKVRLLSIKDMRERGDWTKPTGLDAYPRFFAPKEAPAKPLRVTQTGIEGASLQTVFDEYKTERKLPPLTLKEFNKGIRRFIDLYGDVPAIAINKKMVRDFKNTLRLLPNRLPGALKGKPISVVLAAYATVPPSKTLSNGSINKDIGTLSAVLGWAGAQGHFDDDPNWANPATGLKIRGRKGPSDEDRLPYDLDDLKAIFSWPIFVSGERPKAGGGEAAKWLPLLALFSGGRLNELGQLGVGDVKLERGVWFFEISVRTRGNRAKNKTSVRRVPVHPELIACGFLVYVESRREAGDVRLFPELRPSKQGVITASWSKWWRRYAEPRGFTDERKVFHSFRHTFKTVWRDCGLDETVSDRITGHTPGNVGGDYGKTGVVSALASKMNEMRIEGLDLSHLHIPAAEQ